MARGSYSGGRTEQTAVSRTRYNAAAVQQQGQAHASGQKIWNSGRTRLQFTATKGRPSAWREYRTHARGRHPMDTGGKTLGLSALRAWEKPAPARRERKGRGCQQHASASRSREPEGVTEPTTLPPAPRIGSAGNSLYCRKNMMKSIKQSGMKETVITLDREREGG